MEKKMPFFKRKEKQTGEPDKNRRKGRKKSRLRIVLGALIIIAIVAVVVWQRRQAARAASKEARAVKTATVETRDIVSELSSSGTLAAKDSYSITALVEGEVITADFEEGDQVEKGQVLYEIDKASVETQLNNARNSLSRTQSDYEKAVQEYNKALKDYSGNTYKSTETGYINELSISVGSKVGNNGAIAKLYSDDVMKIRIPFLSGEAALLAPGMGAVLTLVDTGEQVAGTVTAVASQETALTGGRMVRSVTMEVANPGGLTTSTRATAQIGEFVGGEDSTFIATIDTTMNAELPAAVEVASLLVDEGDYVTVGTPLFLMTTETAEDLMEYYADAMDNAEEKVENAQSSLDNTQDNYDDYTITAPISGQVITKSYKVGDNISRNTSSTTTVATIYDLSQLTFQMSIDELDILSVKVGQKVTVTADALEGETYTGTVTNVSLESSYSNGVTTYPVTVTMDETGELLPGMNVDGVITLEEAKGVLAVPSDALMRGNQVYIKDDTVTQQAGPVPAGFRAAQVETGLVSDSYVEVKSGLSEGDVVYVAESSASTAGAFMMMEMGGPGGGPGGGSGQGGGQRSGGGQGGPR